MPEPSTAKVALDIEVPNRFSETVRIGDTTIEVRIEMENGDPHILGLPILIPSMSPTEFAKLDWVQVAWQAVKRRVQIQLNEEVVAVGKVDPERYMSRLEAIDTAADQSRRYNRLNRAQLDEVAELWRTAGALAVADRFCVSRRQADRYVVKAREAGAL